MQRRNFPITALHQNDQVEEAYAIGDRYRREGPRSPRALFRIGWVLAYTGEIARPEALYRDLVELDRGGIYQAWGNGGLAYPARARGEPALAVEHIRRAAAAKPDDTLSRVGLAQMTVNAGAGPGADRGAVRECNDPLISCSGVMFQKETAHEYRDGRRDQALDSASEVGFGS